MRIVNLTGAILCAALVGPAIAADTGVFTGVSSAKRSSFAYVGGVKAMNGDLSANDVLLRGMLFTGTYDYDTVAVTGGKVDARFSGGEIGAGYQWFNPGSHVSLYGGIDHQSHHLNPDDPGNRVKGGKTGAAVQAEFETLGSPWFGGLIAKYSSGHGDYWVRGRAGYAFGGVTLGPELIYEGNEFYKENRYGLFLALPVSKATAVSLSAGHRKSKGDTAPNYQTGRYIDASLSFKF